MSRHRRAAAAQPHRPSPPGLHLPSRRGRRPQKASEGSQLFPPVSLCGGFPKPPAQAASPTPLTPLQARLISSSGDAQRPEALGGDAERSRAASRPRLRQPPLREGPFRGSPGGEGGGRLGDQGAARGALPLAGGCGDGNERSELRAEAAPTAPERAPGSGAFRAGRSRPAALREAVGARSFIRPSGAAAFRRRAPLAPTRASPPGPACAPPPARPEEAGAFWELKSRPVCKSPS